MNATCKRTLLATAIALTLTASSGAWAQDANQQKTSDKSAKLETIVVTAEKRSEDIQNVPMSISVIDNEQLANLHATQLSDYADYIPGLTVVNGGSPGQATLGIRGIAPLGEGATVATYVDETPMGSSGLYGRAAAEMLDLLPWDIQSVEVLRGPQGTLYGASALGGVIRYVTRPPDLDNTSWRVGGDTFTESGSGDLGYGGRFGFNVPLSPGKVALSASIGRQNSPGYTDNVRTGKKNQDDFWQQGAHAQLLWKPNDDGSVRLSALQSRVDAKNSSITSLDPISLKPIYGDLKADNYVPQPYLKNVDYYNALVNWDLHWADFVSSTSYEQLKSETGLDASLVYGVLFPLFGLPDPGISAVIYHIRMYKKTQEFRLVSKNNDKFEWLAGFFWTDENTRQDQVATAQFLDYSPIPGFDPLAVVAFPSSYKEYAGYGDMTYKFTPTFDVTAGVRWAHNEQTFSQDLSGALIGGTTVQTGNSSEGVFTYSLSPRWHFSTDSMAYLRIASGYKPGGPNVALPGVPPSVNASKLTNYEFGVKSFLDDGRLMLDADVYDIEWRKIQVTEAVNGLGYLANGGTARSRGVEFQALYEPVTGLHLGLNAAYTDAVLTQDVPGLGGLDGDRLPNIPKWAWSATADYSFPVSGAWTGRIGGGLRYVGSSMTALTHSPNALPQDSYTVLDVNAGVSNDTWTFRVFIKNLTDERVYTNLFPLTNAGTGEVMQVTGVPLQPRTIGVGFDARF